MYVAPSPSLAITSHFKIGNISMHCDFISEHTDFLSRL